MTGESFELANRAGAAEAIRRMGEEDLRFLNRLIVERLKPISQSPGARRPATAAPARSSARSAARGPFGRIAARRPAWRPARDGSRRRPAGPRFERPDPA